MTHEAHDYAGASDPTRLFEEFLALREEGAEPDPRGFEERAGERAAELRRRLELLENLEELSFLLKQDSGLPAPDLSEIGRFQILQLLGEGGLSRVFLAEDPVLEREVALKVLLPSATGIADERQWIVSEGRALARLEHDSIVRVYEVDEFRGFPYIAMERVRGASLLSALETMRALRAEPFATGLATEEIEAARALDSIASRCRLVARIARALDYCHAAGVIHRDVKPANILLDARHTPKLIDFGLAHQATGTAHLSRGLYGTPAYLAPEQVDRNKSGADAKSDQFALGVLLYELLTLEHPFATEEATSTLAAVARAQPVPPRTRNPAIPADVQRICLHCLARSPERRYPSIGALADDLEAFLGHRAISLNPPSLWREASLWVQRHRIQVVSAVAGLVVGLPLLFGLWVVSERHARTRFATEIEVRRTSVELLEKPGEFEDLFSTVGQSRQTAQDHDRAALAGSLLPTSSERVEALWREGAERLERIVGHVYDQARAHGHRSQREVAYLDADTEWRGALRLLQLSAGSATFDGPFHHLGEVELPPGGALWRYETTLPRYPSLVEVGARGRLPHGLYRYARGTGAALREAEFYVHPLEPRWAPPLNPLADWLHADMVRIDGGLLHFERDPAVAKRYELQPFRILRRLVKWEDVYRVFEREELAAFVSAARRTENIRGPDDPAGTRHVMPLGEQDPATLSWALAHEFAQRVGGRLPSPVELWAAYRETTIEKQNDEMDKEFFDREWTSAVSGVVDEQHHFFLRERLGGDGEPEPQFWLEEPAGEDDLARRTCLRIVRSDPP